MDKFFGNLNAVLGVGFALGLALMASLHVNDVNTSAVLQWLHVFFGITWIGLLYYFNFVQIPTMPSVPAELKPGVSKYIADRKSTRLNSSHANISYAVFCLKKKKKNHIYFFTQKKKTKQKKKK